MKTKFLFITFLISSLSFAQYTAIPDANFENALSGYDDIANDGQVPTANINTLTSLDVSNQSIADLTGIQDFTALTHLYCHYNQLSSLDVSLNTNLIELNCDHNQLTGLNVSQNTNLSMLYCAENQISSLDVSQNTNLTVLSCSNNQLNNLDINQNTNLTDLGCSYNQLSSLNVSQNILISHLYCDHNHLSSLDLSQNINLTRLVCKNNQLISLNVANGNNTIIAYFVANNNPNLTCIEVDDVAWSTTHWTNIDPQTSFSTDCAASVDESTLNETIEIYPNPTNHILNIFAQDSIKNISIYNVTGQEVINMQPNAIQAQVNMSKLQNGIYFVKAQIKGRVRTFKVVKE